MNPRVFIFRFFAAMVAILLMDGLWLGLAMGGFYRERLGSLVLQDRSGGFDPRPLPTLLVYLLIPLGIALFTRPAGGPKPVPSLIRGALFGLVLYGTYDMTNWSLLAGWDGTIALVDTAWGIVLCGTASIVASLSETSLSRRGGR
jgi:uncharacterized membrane protein